MAMNKDEKEHGRGVEELALRLSSKGYSVIFKQSQYTSGLCSGELDVLAIRGKFLHYYEVKVRKCRSSYDHAKIQFKKVKKAFPNAKIKCIYCPMNDKPQIVRQ